VSDRLSDAERIADREHHVADLHRIGVAQHDRREVARLDLEHREIGLRVGADDLRRRRFALAQRHGDGAGAFDHVVVGEHVALRAHHHARAKAAAARILVRVGDAPSRRLGRVDIDDRRQSAQCGGAVARDGLAPLAGGRPGARADHHRGRAPR